MTLGEAIGKAVQAANGDEAEAYRFLKAALDDASPDLWLEIDWFMHKHGDRVDDELRAAVAEVARKWKHRRDHPLKPPPPMTQAIE
jgi:ABC-type nitrate/sulfonate/bicarbonate transport system substrate-binding protein